MNIKKKILLFTAVLITNIIMFSNSIFPREVKGEVPGKIYSIGFMKNIFYNVDVNDVQAALKVWVDETLKQLEVAKNYHFVNRFYSGFDDLNKAVNDENLAVLSISTYDYLNYSNKVNLEPLLVPEIDGEVGVEYYLLVRKESQFNSLIDLKGKSIGLISTPAFIASSLWIDVLLSKAGLPVKTRYFNKIETAQKESQLILNLFFGNLDACIVTKSSFKLMKELNPQIGQKLHSILDSPLYVAGLICCPKSNQNKDVKDGFYNSLMRLHTLTTGKQILTLVKIGKLVPAKAEYFKSFIDLLKDHKKIAK